MDIQEISDKIVAFNEGRLFNLFIYFVTFFRKMITNIEHKKTKNIL